MKEDTDFHKEVIKHNLKQITKDTSEIMRDFWIAEAVQYGVPLPEFLKDNTEC